MERAGGRRCGDSLRERESLLGCRDGPGLGGLACSRSRACADTRPGSGPGRRRGPDRCTDPRALDHARAGFVLVSLSGGPGRGPLPGPQALGAPPTAGSVETSETNPAHRLPVDRDSRSGIRRRSCLSPPGRPRAAALGGPAGTRVFLRDRPVTPGDGLLLDLVAIDSRILLFIRSRRSQISRGL